MLGFGDLSQEFLAMKSAVTTHRPELNDTLVGETHARLYTTLPLRRSWHSNARSRSPSPGEGGIHHEVSVPKVAKKILGQVNANEQHAWIEPHNTSACSICSIAAIGNRIAHLLRLSAYMNHPPKPHVVLS